MAGYISNGMAIDYCDGMGSAVVNGKLWRWEFHRYCGPTFLKKNGGPRRYIPNENHPVWEAFDKWLNIYLEKRKTAKSWEIVEC